MICSRVQSLLVLIGTSMSGCKATEAVCVRPSIGAVVATISDSLSGAPRALGARLIVRDGAFADSASGVSPEELALTAGFDTLSNGGRVARPGTYDVSVTAPGYAEWRRTNVRVGSDRCGVVPVRLLARLVR